MDILAGIVLLAAAALIIAVYNRLVAGRNRCRNALAQIQVQLKRRHDLIPNLVETAKAYIGHEQDTLTAVMAARNQAAGLLQQLGAQSAGAPVPLAGLAEYEGVLSAALRQLAVTVEAYPELKADAALQSLNEELSSTENRIAFARQAYNDAAEDYNNSRESFPAVLFAGFFGHHSAAQMLHFDDHAAIARPAAVNLQR